MTTSGDVQTAVSDALNDTHAAAPAPDTGSTAVSNSSSSSAAPTGPHPVIQLTLTGPYGEILKNPPFHFEVGSVVLAIDPIPRFAPGLYTVAMGGGGQLVGGQVGQALGQAGKMVAGNTPT